MPGKIHDRDLGLGQGFDKIFDVVLKVEKTCAALLRSRESSDVLRLECPQARLDLTTDAGHVRPEHLTRDTRQRLRKEEVDARPDGLAEGDACGTEPSGLHDARNRLGRFLVRTKDAPADCRRTAEQEPIDETAPNGDHARRNRRVDFAIFGGRADGAFELPRDRRDREAHTRQVLVRVTAHHRGGNVTREDRRRYLLRLLDHGVPTTREDAREIFLHERRIACIAVVPARQRGLRRLCRLAAQIPRSLAGDANDVVSHPRERLVPNELLKPTDRTEKRLRPLVLGVPLRQPLLELVDRLGRTDRLETRDEMIGLPEAVSQKGRQVLGAVQVVRQVVGEIVERTERSVRPGGDLRRRGLLFGGRPEPLTGGLKQIDRINSQTPLVPGPLQLCIHRKALERIDDPLRIATLETRAEFPIRLEVLLRAVEVYDQENAAEKAQKVGELVEDLLEKQVVGFHDEDGTRCRIAELTRHEVVAELHSAIEPRGVDEDGTRFGEWLGRHPHVDAAQSTRHVHRWLEVRAVRLDLANRAGEVSVGGLHERPHRIEIGERIQTPVVARDGELLLGAVRDVHHARVCRECRHLTHICGRERVHQRRLAALQWTENDDVGLLLGHFFHDRPQLMPKVDDLGKELPQRRVRRQVAHPVGEGFERLQKRSNATVEVLAELTENRLHDGIFAIREAELKVPIRNSPRNPAWIPFSAGCAQPADRLWTMRRPAPGGRLRKAAFRTRRSPHPGRAERW